jgi:hypothetical protein
LSKRFGPAGDGYQYHHIVTQGGQNATKIPAAQLQNTDNIVRLPTLIHEAVTAEYLGPAQRMKQRHYTNGCKVSLTAFSARKVLGFFGNYAF